MYLATEQKSICHERKVDNDDADATADAASTNL